MTEDEEKRLLEVVAGLVPATAQQVGVALGKLSIRLGELTNQLGAADEVATALIEEHDLAYDLAYVRLIDEDGRMAYQPIARAKARIETHELRLRMETAKSNVRKLDKAHKTLDRRIDVGRTQAATVRSEHRNIGYGQAS